MILTKHFMIVVDVEIPLKLLYETQTWIRTFCLLEIFTYLCQQSCDGSKINSICIKANNQRLPWVWNLKYTSKLEYLNFVHTWISGFTHILTHSKHTQTPTQNALSHIYTSFFLILPKWSIESWRNIYLILDSGDYYSFLLE